MCQDMYLPRLGPLEAGHVGVVGNLVPAQRSFAADVYRALTAHLNPALNLLPTLVVMKEWLEQGRLGLLAAHKVVRIPLSIVDDAGTRHRPPLVCELHEAWLSFAMAAKNCLLLDRVVANHGLAFARTCSCGLIMGRPQDVADFMASETLAMLDSYRSSLDRRGMPVFPTLFEDLPERTIDMTPAEFAMFTEIDRLVESMVVQVPYNEARFLEARGLIAAGRTLMNLADSAREQYAVLV